MLGSVHDADDAVQETLIRAWRGAAGLRAATSARSWLYTIATNVCLTELERRRRRVLPLDLGPAVEGQVPPGQPAVESVWLEPYPDAALGDGRSSPEAEYEQRESVELAFVAAVQHLGANQRAVLMLRDVLGFSAQETAAMLASSVASVNSALQRARAAIADRTPARSQQATLRALGEARVRSLVEQYVQAWESCDVPAFAALLTRDATFAMPPLRTWYAPREQVVEWARRYSITPQWRWKVTVTSANGQPALGFYVHDREKSVYEPFALNVLTLDDGLVSAVTAFIVRATGADDSNAYMRFPDRPMHHRLEGLFSQFGLPDRLN